MSQALEFYKKVGNEEFTKMIINGAPYFGTIDPVFVELKPGYAEVKFSNTKKVHNHLGSVHAIAMCNAAELAAGLMTEVSIPDTNRWIPIEMTVKYLKKAKTDLKIVADGTGINWALTGDIKVPVNVYNTEGEVVLTALITMNVSLKK